MGDERRKIAVLGGGCGAMATAFALSSTPELRDRFDITVYTPGWRLGGKGASGRNQVIGDRIEEHGLHVWFGFYLEAFRMLEAAYDELDRPPGTPAATAATAFTPVDGVVVYDDYDGAWSSCDVSLPFRLPPGGGELPRMDDSVDDTGFPTHLTVAQVTTRWVDELWTWLRGELPDHGDALAAIERDLERVAIPERLERALDGHPGPPPTHRLGMLRRIIERGEAWVLDHTTGLVRVLRDLLLDLLEPLLHVRQVRLVWTTLDVALTAFIGIGADRIYDRGFASIDHLDFLVWLRSHGARPLTIGTNAADRAPALRAMYDTSFAFAGGDLDQPDGAAGVALATAIRMVMGYQGHFLYRMNGGMGDIVFTPLYQALHQRGVRFEFFRSVTDIRLDAHAGTGIGDDPPTTDTATDGSLGTIEEFDVVHQVQLTGDGYQPLVEVKNMMCWPNQPLWDQLADGTELAQRGVDFEREANPLDVRPVTMRRGEDFDFVVMAIPPAASRPLCRAFADAEPWRSFYATTGTVATQAFQLWFDRAPADLGYPHDPNDFVGSFVEPLDTFVPMQQLVDRENWPATAPMAGIAYVCGVLPDGDAHEQGHADRVAERSARRFFTESLPTLMPDVQRQGEPVWDVLATVDDTHGAPRFATQYWRGNSSPSERYTLSVAGSIAHRLTPGGTGITNLAVAGDWVANAIGTGCIEAVVMTGLGAADAVVAQADALDRARVTVGAPTGASATGSAAPVGGAWASAGGDSGAGSDAPMHVDRDVAAADATGAAEDRPPFVDFGSSLINTAPGPSVGHETHLFGWFVRGDRDKLDAYAKRVLTDPTGGAHEYRVLSEHVFVTVGEATDMRCETPPWTDVGWMVERAVSLFMFVGRVGHHQLGVRTLDQVCAWVPYIFVDNPVSLTIGRTTFGFPKDWGWFDVPAADSDPGPITLEVLGGDFHPDNQAMRRPLLSVTPTVPTTVDAPEGNELHHLLSWLRHQLGHGWMLPGWSLLEEMWGGIHDGHFTSLFIRQLRNQVDPTTAVYRALHETPSQAEDVSFRLLPHAYRFEPEVLDSHPLVDELGLVAQDVPFGIELGFRMRVDGSSPFWETPRT